MTEAPTVGIGHLLKEGGRFLIPHHQRDYSWTEDELDNYSRTCTMPRTPARASTSSV